MTEWLVESNDRSYRPIPESWLEHPRSIDEDGHGPRCLAVSVYIFGGRVLRVRYAHPVSGNVVETFGTATSNPDGDGYVPWELANGQLWRRSLIPSPDPQLDTARTCEMRHMRDVWGDRLDDVAFDYEREDLDADPEERLVADGGRERSYADVPGQFSATLVDDPVDRAEYGDVQQGAPEDYRDELTYLDSEQLLQEALDQADDDRARYHIRQALQQLVAADELDLRQEAGVPGSYLPAETVEECDQQ